MESTVINHLIESWTQEARVAIYAALTKLQVGTIRLDEFTKTSCILLKAESVPAKSTTAVCARSYQRLHQAKLLILEPQFEQIEHEIITETISKTWWRTQVKTKTIEHKHMVTVPRGAWRVRGMFVGCQLQFPTETDISGDLFGPEGTMTLRNATEAGLDITLQVENITTQSMPFYAAVIGREDTSGLLRQPTALTERA